jgi:hypothetical protein
MSRLILLMAWLFHASPASDAIQSASKYYDLGGACQDRPYFIPGNMDQAEKTAAWDRAIDLRKEYVRASCGNEFRWYQVVKTLLLAHRPEDALCTLQEMDARGFEINPSLAVIEEFFPEVKAFLSTQSFKSSPLGVKVEGPKAISNERRARFRARLRNLPANQIPPENYIARNACPFECCQYGIWSVLTDTDLVASPGSRQIIGKAAKGRRVTALTGEVHLKPEPVVVLAGSDLPKDTIAFILDDVGEGYGHVLSRGKVVVTSLGFAEFCFRPSAECWGETLLPPSEKKKPVWWIKIKLANGVTGWTDKADHFSGTDSCA